MFTIEKIFYEVYVTDSQFGYDIANIKLGPLTHHQSTPISIVCLMAPFFFGHCAYNTKYNCRMYCKKVHALTVECTFLIRIKPYLLTDETKQ